MSDKSKIEWTDTTWNPIRGCTVVSEGCRNCYAMAVAARFSGTDQAYEGLAYRNESGAHWTGKVRLIEEHLEDPFRWKRPRRIFVNSMSDLFHPDVPDEWIDRILAVMAVSRALRPGHVFQILTKRPQRAREYLDDIQNNLMTRLAENIAEFAGESSARVGLKRSFDDDFARAIDPSSGGWPLPNVWLGVSVEDQKTADERIPLLLETPAAVRWISAEPLLGPVELKKYLSTFGCSDCVALDWVVVGGESGPHARPMHPDWARSLRDQCVVARVPFFFKQWGEWDGSQQFISDCQQPCGRCVMALRSWDGKRWSGSQLTGMDWVAGGGHTGALQIHRVGKKTAGRRLDGREWNEYPEKAVIA